MRLLADARVVEIVKRSPSTDDHEPLSWRLVCGALAGMVATAPMTAAMRRFHGQLPKRDCYPLPPREIVSSTAPVLPEVTARNASVLAHFAYGALSGAALAALKRRPPLGFGITGGAAIWLGSYFGWIPAAGVLKPANEHPASRNAGMILTHVAWGSAFALADTELLKAKPIFAGGPIKDRA